MKEIYLILTDTGSRISRFFKFFSGARYNHVSICLDNELEEFYSFARKKLYFPLIGGFVIENKNMGIYKIFKDTACVIYKMEVDKDKYDDLKLILDKYISNPIKYRYNLIGLLGLIINRPVKMKNRYFCSQFVATLLCDSNIYHFEKDPSLIIPLDFQSVPGISIVYEGRLCEYNPLSINNWIKIEDNIAS